MVQHKLFTVSLMAVILLASMTSAYDVGRFLNKRWQMMRRNTCSDSAGKCFTSAECCEGLVCAAIDDYFGQQPETPGYCVKEKELQPCLSQVDCSSETRCLSLGRTGERYCVPNSGGYRQQQLIPVVQNSESKGSDETVEQATASKGLGENCVISADCKTTSGFSHSKLCCQNVHRGRQGVRRICDRMTAISVCI